MNKQATRQGKLQIELDRAQLGTLIWALNRTATVTLDARQRAEASDMASWLIRRGARRWGGINGKTRRQRGRTGETDQGRSSAHLAACQD